jgi:hypothetical protein
VGGDNVERKILFQAATVAALVAFVFVNRKQGHLLIEKRATWVIWQKS